MDASERPLQPVAIVLHTRDRQDDYRWFPEIGAGQLVGRLKEIHRALIADQDARPAATFVLLDEEARIGLLVANMKTPRQDHLRTHIDDTLLLEFEACDRAAILRITAGLLNTEVGVIQQRLLDYAEAEFRQTQGAARRSAASLTLPVIASVSDADDWPTDRYVALRSNAANRHRIASLLHAAADGREGILRPFILVSTGFVGKERLEQHAGHGQQFVALTRSSNLPENEDLRLEPDGCEKKASYATGEEDQSGRGHLVHRIAGRVGSAVGSAGENISERLREAVVPELRQQVKRLQDEVERLREEVKELRREIEETQRAVDNRGR